MGFNLITLFYFRTFVLICDTETQLIYKKICGIFILVAEYL